MAKTKRKAKMMDKLNGTVEPSLAAMRGARKAKDAKRSFAANRKR